jgi:hypothetical protein
MRRMLGLAAAAALALSVSAASADEITGTVSNIDLTRATFMVDGRTFTADPNNTVGTNCFVVRASPSQLPNCPAGRSQKFAGAQP